MEPTGRIKDDPQAEQVFVFAIEVGDRGECTVISPKGLPPGSSADGTYGDVYRAYDAICSRLQGKGLTVRPPAVGGPGYLIEAKAALLYAPGAIQAIDEIKDLFGERVRKEGIRVAEEQGRRLVSADDMWAAMERLIGNLLDEGSQDG